MSVSEENGAMQSIETSLCAEIGLFPQCAGSARWLLDKNHVISSIYGPMEVKMNKEITERAAVVVEVRPMVGPATLKESILNRLLSSLFNSVILAENYPRTQILLQVQMVSRSDPVLYSPSLAAIVNCLYLACLDAGLPMKHSLVAVSLCDSRVTAVVDGSDQSKLLGMHYAATIDHIHSQSLTAKEMICNLGNINSTDVDAVLEIYKRLLSDKYLAIV